MTPVLEARTVTVRYGGVTAVDDVSFAVARAETCGLIGPNGAGKTTLFDSLSGLTRPSAGRILMNGEDVTAHSAVARARSGMRRTFQRHQLFGRLTVLDNVLMAAEWHGGGGGVFGDVLGLPWRRRLARERRERAREFLRLCGLDAVADTYAGGLSIGSARMVELARALMDEPRILLLDEPTSGLDEADTDRLRRVLRTVTASGQCSVLLVAHDVGFVMDVCDHIVVLDLGQVIADGLPQDVRDDPRVHAAYLVGSATDTASAAAGQHRAPHD
ncbi:MAG: ABC transporter ATP-binding protein [Streptomycetaceae bacterium]|nr:ABC transporter ATP-binding protein [Streptomycetaceae bacterium]